MRHFSRLYGLVWLVIFLLTGVGLLAAQQPATTTETLAAQATPTAEVLIMTPIAEVTAEVTLETTPEVTATVVVTATPRPLEDENYTVIRGDRLIKIAERYDVPLTCLVRANRIVNPNLIYIGQVLLIPTNCQDQGGGEITTTAATTRTTSTVTGAGIVGGGQCQFDRYAGRVAPGGVYTIRAGDTLDYIACDFGIALTCLLESNPAISENRGNIHAGDPVTINLACPVWEGPDIP